MPNTPNTHNIARLREQLEERLGNTLSPMGFYGDGIDLTIPDTIPENTPCMDCKKIISKRAKFSRIGDYYICSLCKKLYRECQSCGKSCHKKVLFKTKDKSYLCVTCKPKWIFNCVNCKGVFFKGRVSFEVISPEDENEIRVCRVCYDRYYYLCIGCQSYPSKKTQGKKCQYCRRYLDATCFLAHTRNRCQGRENMYNFYEGKENGKIIDVKRFVGIEIEGERGDIDTLREQSLPKDVRLAHDGSLDESGVEVQTPPASLNKLEEIIHRTCEALKEAEYKGTQACGMHVHIDARDIKNDPQKITQLIKTFYAVEDLLYSMLPPSRWENKYCKRLSRSYLFGRFTKENKKAKLETEWYKEKSVYRKEQMKSHKYNDTRYAGFNLHSVFYRGTLELRYHSGTVREEKILAWTYILLHIFDWAINNYDEKIVAKFFDRQTDNSKFHEFIRTFGIKPEIAEYMGRRISKFNRNYLIKFNKGKPQRELEKEESEMLKEGLKTKIKQLRKQKNIDLRKYSEYTYRLQTIDQEESGFITDKDIIKVLSMLNVGTQIRQSVSDEEEREEVRTFEARI